MRRHMGYQWIFAVKFKTFDQYFAAKQYFCSQIATTYPHPLVYLRKGKKYQNEQTAVYLEHPVYCK